MNNQHMLNLLHVVFPDETVQTGQTLRKRQAEVINMIVLELKQRKASVAALQKSATA